MHESITDRVALAPDQTDLRWRGDTRVKRTRRKNKIVRHGKHAHIEEMDTIFEKGWLVRSGEKSQNRGFELYPDAEAYWSRIERGLDAEG